MKKVTKTAKIDASEFEDDAGKATVTDKQLSVIATLAARQQGLEEAIAQQDNLLAELNNDLKQLSEYDLPSAMAEIGMSEFKLTDGTKITIKPEIYPNIAQDRKAEAFAWMEKNGHGDLIKCEFTAKLGRGPEVKKAVAELQKVVTKLGLDAATKEGVHPGTLKAFVKEQLEEGRQLPECIGVHKVNRSVIKAPK